MTGLRLQSMLAVAASALLLASCGGGAEVASPGEGNFPGGNPSNPGGGNGNPGQGQPAAACPTGFDNVGLVASGTLRACRMPQQINGNLTLSNVAGVIYTFTGRTAVGTDRGVDPANPTPGSTAGILTIDPGVRIFANGGSDYLIVNRGSQIFAEGTATQPIIFTSRQAVEGGNTIDSQGQWGGLILAGRAPDSNCNIGAAPAATSCTGIVDGTTELYGGATANDNSGRVRYVQINFSGFALSPGNELQGLTMAGVGSGTVVDHIQVHNSADDGIEIFGGNVNMSHIVITGADDDGLDTDRGWRGGAQFGIVTQRPHVKVSDGRSAGFEFSSAPTTIPLATRYVSQGKISNFTLVGRSTTLDVHTIAHMDTGADPTIINSVFTSAAPSASGCLSLNDADTVTSAPTFASIFMSCSLPYRPGSTQAQTQTAFTAGTNNTPNGTSTLTAPAGALLTNQTLTFINGANETAVTPASASTVNPFFTNVPYIGAVRNAADTWYLGWTCGLAAGAVCR